MHETVAYTRSVDDEVDPAAMPDLTGRTAVVTGANSGIGLPTALELARHGARVIATARTPDKGAETVRRILREVPDAWVEPGLLDLADLASVRRFAAGVTEVDLLVNNAGIAMVARQLTRDGFELQLGTNHLGHFALTGLLLPLLAARPGARVVTVSSDAHAAGRFDFDDLGLERGYGRMSAYARSSSPTCCSRWSCSGGRPRRRGPEERRGPPRHDRHEHREGGAAPAARAAAAEVRRGRRRAVAVRRGLAGRARRRVLRARGQAAAALAGGPLGGARGAAVGGVGGVDGRAVRAARARGSSRP
ncbi:SDR family NAD(P)-dependent oxidoreductase [Nonomuraea thailandensis]